MGRNIPHAAPQGCTGIALQHLPFAAQPRPQRAGPVGHRPFHPLDPDHCRTRLIGRPADIERRAQRRPQRRQPPGQRAPPDKRHLRLRHRLHAKRHLGDHRQRAVRSDQQLAQVQTGHILHHPATGLDHDPGPVDKAQAQDMIAARPDLNPARPRCPRRHDAPQRRGAVPVQQAPQIGHLERQALPFTRQHGLDLGQGRPGPGHQRQRPRFVNPHPGQRRSVDPLAQGNPQPTCPATLRKHRRLPLAQQLRQFVLTADLDHPPTTILGCALGSAIGRGYQGRGWQIATSTLNPHAGWPLRPTETPWPGSTTSPGRTHP